MCVGEFVSELLVQCTAPGIHLSPKEKAMLARLDALHKDGITPSENAVALRLVGELSGSCF
jgi:hypothetical protein